MDEISELLRRQLMSARAKILVIHGDNVSVSSSFDTRNISKLSLGDLTHYDIIISSSPLYSSIDDEFFHVNRIIDLLYKRIS